MLEIAIGMVLSIIITIYITLGLFSFLSKIADKLYPIKEFYENITYLDLIRIVVFLPIYILCYLIFLFEILFTKLSKISIWDSLNVKIFNKK